VQGDVLKGSSTQEELGLNPNISIEKLKKNKNNHRIKGA
jgi:hypothetical protein